MHNVIELKNINKIYGSVIKTQVLNDINISFEAGTFNSIIGASGSGKSTLLNIMGTLDKPTSGEIYINGIRTDNMKKNELARLRNKTIGFIFQFHYLLPEFTALENVLMPYMIGNSKPSKEIKEKADELLELVGLTKVKNNLATNMSGGQQQRTAIARALINNPKIVLADEPTGNLDSESTESIYTLLRAINEKLNTTFIVITHDNRIAEKTDRIIEVKDGRIVMDTNKRDTVIGL
ncbi:ABC transporter ATP-binding protein [Clostridium folliculivorans]|uniref:Lipoprotein-releasing system ATP-binding protein LolD n=1 Tax=Clostridium folliculivorans TaxID=2886038 RepID=A0A9W6D9Z5_9CLOT|nr:ABC transporter ATP-binding protein [Clostridium folliculivorans]GKU24855.1 lipoprotein-releasing system ATP-binding protein LolD [Clostridium folliculivorans]GKU30953.1 lipoprotein-releasing system ATP-binding protein LolD [Clostridium folliculivorans]